MALVKRFDIFLVTLDPTRGAEIQKTRPCVVVSPDELHQNLRTAIVAPLTTVLRSYPTRVELVFADKTGQIALDQIRTVDKTRLIKYLGTLEEDTARQVSTVLVEMFTY
ncbi:MAG: type II toxin-antitoxin system PemK/MazF family toxin [Gemmatimonadaceae bacterium]|nr:type II toxin-antitoxin system PemK/MazF family toxin [Gloeobacterales cyanobacterium ES-bin-141]